MKFGISRDDRQLAYIETQREGDVWMMILGAEEGAEKTP